MGRKLDLMLLLRRVLLVTLFAFWGYSCSTATSNQNTNNSSTYECRENRLDTCLSKCENGKSDVCFALAIQYEQGHKVSKDSAKAVHFYDKACNLGMPSACTSLGIIYEKANVGVQAVTVFEKGCNGNDQNACTHLARLLIASKKKDNLKHAVSLLSNACQKNLLVACAELGHVFENGGPGIVKDIKQATNHYENACNKDAPLGCYYLAALLETDRKTKKNIPHSISLYEKACKLKLGAACTVLAIRLDRDETQSDTLIAEYYELGCKYGDPVGCCMLGDFYKEGRGFFSKDIAKAKTLYQQACSAGHTPCCTDRLKEPKKRTLSEEELQDE